MILTMDPFVPAAISNRQLSATLDMRQPIAGRQANCNRTNEIGDLLIVKSNDTVTLIYRNKNKIQGLTNVMTIKLSHPGYIIGDINDWTTPSHWKDLK